MNMNFTGAAAAYGEALARATKASGIADDGAVVVGGAGKPNFADMVRDVVGEAKGALARSEAVGIKALTKEADVTEIVTAVTNAELTLQTVVAVRDRVLQAYQEIIKMPI